MPLRTLPRPLSRIVALALACLLLAGTAQAQRFAWWRDEGVQRRLGLAADQTRRLEDLFTGALPDLKRGKRQLDAAEQEMARLVDGADDSILTQQVDRVEAARSELNKTRAMMLLRMRRVLSAEQRARLDIIHKERQSTGSAPHRH